MTRTFLGMGSNMGDRRRFLRDAVDALGAEATRVSDVYETEPVGGPEQGRFLNIVVELETERSPEALLDCCHQLEAAAGRVRRERWGPRTLDVDILWIDGLRVDTPTLQVPHPRMFARRFVMAPLADLASELLPEGWEDLDVSPVERLGALD